MRARVTPLLITLITAVVLALATVAPVAARAGHGGSAASSEADFEVSHGPVEVALTPADSDGHQPGDLRVVSVAIMDESGTEAGRLDATLTTTAVDVPAAGDERRLGVLVFSFGDDDEHQITVHGSAHYPAQGPTIATGDVTVRPIVGGTGKFVGISGTATTTHHDDDTWTHGFDIDPGWSAADVRNARKAARDADRAERQATRKAAQAERKEARAAIRAERKADRSAASDHETTAIDELYTTAASDGTGVVRTDLGLAEPGSAPGEELGLWHYLIPGQTDLVPHTHPGWQLARVTDGELEYTVIEGEGVLLRGDASEPMGPGTYVLATGDGVIENPDLVHRASNRTDEPVTLISATLFAAGEPISTLIEDHEEPSEATTAETAEETPTEG